MRKHIVLVLSLCLGGCGPGEEQKALKVSVATLDAAINQGVNESKFSDLALDFRTKFELAKPSLSSSASAAVENAIISVEATKSLWDTVIFTRGRCILSCVNDLRAALIRLELIKSASDYDKYMRDKGALDPGDFNFDYVFRDTIIQSALGVAATKLELAKTQL